MDELDARYQMIRRLSLLCLLVGAGCDRAEPESKGSLRNLENWYEARKKEDAARQLELEEWRAERARVEALPPLENALDPEGRRQVARGFVVSKSDSEPLEILETLVGRTPSDPEEYLPDTSEPGYYFVGSFMPRGGYSIDGTTEERFCIPIHTPDMALDWPDVAARMSLAALRERLNPKSEQGSAGQPATRSESDSEGSDKPQPESEGRSR